MKFSWLKKKKSIATLIILIISVGLFFTQPRVEGIYRSDLMTIMLADHQGYLIFSDNKIYGCNIYKDEVIGLEEIGDYKQNDGLIEFKFNDFPQRGQARPGWLYLDWIDYEKVWEGEPLRRFDLSLSINPFRNAKIYSALKKLKATP